MNRSLLPVAAAALALASAAPAAAEPAATTSAPAGPLPGLAVGVEVGEPTALTAGYTLADLGLNVSAGIGSGTLSGTGLQLHADIHWMPLVVKRAAAVRFPIWIGLSGRYYRHHYEPASIDELTDTHAGVRLPIGAAVTLAAMNLEIYLEVAPGYDLYRSESCSLISGTDSICPHTMSSRGFVDGAIGVRYYLGL